MNEQIHTPEGQYAAALAVLPAKQRKFVMEYLVDLHGQNAATRAGYSAATARSQASRMLTNVNIRDAITAGMAVCAMPASEVLHRLTLHAGGSMADFLRVAEEDVTLTWSLLAVPTTPEGDPDVTSAVLKLASQENVQPTDRILHTATVKRSAARLDLLEAEKRGKLGLIKKITIDENGKIVIDLYDAQAALKLLGKHHKLFSEQALQLNLDMSTLTTDQLERIAAGENPLHVLRRAE